jgi:peptidoglycan/LPS O-acetylase OafA/YrhL
MSSAVHAGGIIAVMSAAIPSSHSSLRYRPEIDGMRAIAVLTVMLYHAGAPFLRGGYVGVDVFFVISGYLITSMMVAQHQSGSFSLLQFYERRARRILPALFFVLLVVSATAWVMIPETLMHDTYGSVMAALGMSSNIVFWRTLNYWDPMASLRPLLHTWSLGVEEQFYLLYPLLFALLWKSERNGRRWFVPAVLAIAALSMGLLFWLRASDESAAFYLLPTRAWELLAGAVVAWLLPNHERAWESAKWHMRMRQLGGCVGVALIFLAVWDGPFDNAARLMMSVAGAMLLLAFATPTTWVGRVLASRPFVGVGLISYSAYLIHQPAFVAVRLWHPADPGLPVMLGASIVVLLLAWVTWRFVEQPFRQERVIGRCGFLATMAAGGIMIGTLGVLGRMTDVPQIVLRATSTERQREVYDETFVEKIVEPRSECWLRLLHEQPAIVAAYDACVRRYGRAIVVLGDSHGADLYTGLEQTLQSQFVVRIPTAVCGAAVGPCSIDAQIEFLRTRPESVRLVLYLDSGRKYMRTDAHGVTPDIRKIDARLSDLAFILTQLQGSEVYMIGPYVEPTLVVQPLLRYAYACELGRAAVQPEIAQRFERVDAVFRRRSTAFPGVRYVSTIRHYAEDGSAYLYDCSASYWRDSNHLTAAGQRRLVKWLAPDIPAIAGR